MNSSKMRWKLPLVAVGVGVLIVLAILFDLPSLLVQGLEFINSLGAVGVLIFILLYITATVALIPGLILTLGAGFVFGLGIGTAAVSIGSTIGATAAFLLGRSLFREWIAEKIAGNERFSAIDKAVAEEGWKIVFLTRLSPIFPFNVINYAYGLTRIKAGPFFLASWIGMLPGTFAYIYIGSLAGDVASVAAGTSAITTAADSNGLYSWLGPTLRVVGLVATLLVTILITRIARKALRKHIDT